MLHKIKNFNYVSSATKQKKKKKNLNNGLCNLFKKKEMKNNRKENRCLRNVHAPNFNKIYLFLL